MKSKTLMQNFLDYLTIYFGNKLNIKTFIVLLLALLFIIPFVKKYFRKLWNIVRIDVTPSRFIFVTSCDNRIGRNLVQALDELGFSVFAGCNTRTGADKIKQTCSEKVLPVLFDVRSTSSIDDECMFITRTLPVTARLWAIIHNGAVTNSPSLFEWTNQDDLHDVINVNLISGMRMCKNLLPWLRRSRGRIVMTTSVQHFGFPTWTGHSVAMEGAKAFCTCLRRELYKTALTIHSVGYDVVYEPGQTRQHVKHWVNKAFDDLIPEVQWYYGEAFVEFLTDAGAKVTSKPPSIPEIVEMYVAAISQRYPARDYRLERGGALASLYRWFPARLQERLCQRRVPVPDGVKRH